MNKQNFKPLLGRAGRGSKRRHVLYGKLGAASACRRIGIMRAKYDRLTRDKRAKG
jgi:hypothetical protein